MKYLKIFLFFVLCYINLSETIRYDETDNLSLIVNNMITSNTSWKSIIIPHRKILINNEFQTIEMYLTQLPEQMKPSNSSSQTTYFVTKSNVLQTLNFMYTALNCEYAYLIRDILKHLYYESNKTFESLKNLQKSLGKVIFNLFTFKDLSSDLKSSDQTLTVSLLSIHVFLYTNEISNKENTNVLLTKWIHQMISLIEIFICKICFFEFAENDLSKQKPDLKIYSREECLSRLDDLSDIGLNNNTYINHDMYKPYIFLMYDYTNYIGSYDLMIQSPSVTKKTMDILESLIKSHDVKNVLIYQIFLIESLRSLFSQQIIYVLQNDSNDYNERLFKLYKLYVEFQKYTDLIPDNYPPTFLKFIYDIENALKDYLESGKDNFESLISILNDIMKTKSIIHLMETKTSKIDSMTIITITDLIKKIKVSPYFPSFKQTFEILLQEPDILKNYYLLDEISFKNITNSVEPRDEYCSNGPKIRLGFIWFWLMLDRMPDKEVAKHLNSYLTTIVQHVIYLYEFKDTKEMVKNTLLNLLNHVNDSTSQSFANINSSEFIRLKQLVLSIVITMDYQELNYCNVTEENKTIHGELMVSSNLPFFIIQEEIDVSMKEICKMTDHLYNNTFNVQKGQTYTNTIKSLRDSDWSRTQFYWYVYRKQVLNVCQDLYQNYKTPDNLQIDYRFQLTVLEWYSYQAIVKVFYIFKIRDELPSNEQIDFIKEVLKKFRQSLTFSTYLMRIVRYFINIYLDYFENKPINQESIKNFTVIAKKHAPELVPQYSNISIHKFKHVIDVYNLFKIDIEFIKKYFIDTTNIKLIVDENNLIMSMFWDELNMKK